MITLATLPQASEQEVFDQVARHLLTQGEKAFDGACGYRVARLGGTPLMCAAGCLIAPEEYKSTFEGMGWPRMIENGYVPKAHGELIYALQQLHDQNPPEFWPQFLINIAAKHELNAQVVQETLATRTAP